MAVLLEIPIFGPASAAIAVSAGASRLELNASESYSKGGLTPSLEDLSLLQDLEVPIRVMIRPRGAPSSGVMDFVYSEKELEAMEQSIREFKISGLMKRERGDGFVFGVLREHNNESAADSAMCPRSAGVVLATDQCKRLTDASRPFGTVFHRAFDELVEFGQWKAALEDLVGLGFDGILTSGGRGNAADNVDKLDRVLRAFGDRIEIIVGGGVRSTNVRRVMDSLGPISDIRPPWAHSSCLTTIDRTAVDEKEIHDILANLR
jgi:copper homeostasis protein